MDQGSKNGQALGALAVVVAILGALFNAVLTTDWSI